ncbi:hypothetical protein FA95DRAFT_404516 [Auriscalpium vulgare]|uniref:Uncharacterized protein n=1 Tax=Auriscalpium vulgare TaxID=40419 RepID=A0ACB8RH57_9AGAM|nr:hypothetical protein FA95DRAFT_404516 [Auriscalpium vulgare]
MPPSLPPGEARPAPKPQPIGSFPFILLFTTTTLCVLFIIWRRVDSLRAVVVYQLKTWTRQEGTIRLSEDDGPPARSFLEDEYDEDNDGLNDEPLALCSQELRTGRAAGQLPAEAAEQPPLPPPKD